MTRIILKIMLQTALARMLAHVLEQVSLACSSCCRRREWLVTLQMCGQTHAYSSSSSKPVLQHMRPSFTDVAPATAPATSFTGVLCYSALTVPVSMARLRAFRRSCSSAEKDTLLIMIERDDTDMMQAWYVIQTWYKQLHPTARNSKNI